MIAILKIDKPAFQRERAANAPEVLREPNEETAKAYDYFRQLPTESYAPIEAAFAPGINTTDQYVSTLERNSEQSAHCIVTLSARVDAWPRLRGLLLGLDVVDGFDRSRRQASHQPVDALARNARHKPTKLNRIEATGANQLVASPASRPYGSAVRGRWVRSS
jgi:hypothetical protein